MKARSEDLWQEAVKDMLETEHGKMFHEFSVAWATAAENVISQAGDGADPAEAIRLTLPLVESQYERKTVWIVGQCLVLFCMHWIHGEKLAEKLTEVEMRLVQDITAAKIAQLQQEAEKQVAE